MQIDKEIWSNIPDVVGYKISSHGNILGKKDRPYKASINTKGYPCVRIPKQIFSQAVHRIVAKIFIGDNPGGLQVNHKDGNKLNNKVSNLEYVSCRDNINHAIRTGLRSATINLKSKSIFTDVDVRIIKEACLSGFRNQEISRYYQCHHSTISKIRRGTHYPKVTL